MERIFKNRLRDMNKLFQVKDPMSALSHFIGFLMSIVAMPVLLIYAFQMQRKQTLIVAYAIYLLSMILLYGASSAYHSFSISERGNRILKKIDHISVCILIAGTYTPVCIGVMDPVKGRILLIAVWTVALMGMILKAFFVYVPRYVSTIMYLLMGWLALWYLPDLYHMMSTAPFFFLLLGGILYSIGSLIYAIRKPLISLDGFGNHELFHLFVLGGSLCHYVMMFLI